MRLSFVTLLILGLLSTTAALADLPDPTCIQCSLDITQRLLLIPDEHGLPYGEFDLVVHDMWDCQTPIANAIVEVLIGGLANSRTKLCGSAITTGRTDETGHVRMNIVGGGCFRGQNALSIRVNGVEIRNFQAVLSPDYAGWDNQGQPNRWSLSMNPQDLAAFAVAYQGGMGGPSCHDYNNNGSMDPADLSVFAAAYRGGTGACSP